MKLLFFIFFVLVSAALLFGITKAKKKEKKSDAPWPFYAKKPLSVPEQVLYFRLCQALPEFVILAQVGLSRILGVKKGNNLGEWLNRINRMSIDFVICAKDSSIVAVIELDDSSHERADRQRADARKDKALSSAGIRLIRWHVKSIPDAETIRSMFIKAQSPESSTSRSTQVPSPNSEAKS